MSVVDGYLNSTLMHLHLAKLVMFAVKILGHCQAAADFRTAKARTLASHPAVASCLRRHKQGDSPALRTEAHNQRRLVSRHRSDALKPKIVPAQA